MMARRRSVLGEDVSDLLQRNGGLFTVFAVLLIVATGVAIFDRPDRWWWSAVAVTVFAVVAFLFMNARVFVKAVVASILVLVMGSYGFKLGATMDPQGVSGTIWMTSMYSTFFACLAGSFIWPSGKSRWGVVTATSVAGFAGIFLMAAGGIPLGLAILLGNVFSVALFFLWYRFGKAARYKADAMPTVSTSEELVDSLHTAAIETGRGAWKRQKKETNSLVFWNETVAFQLVGLHLEQAFGVGGRRGQYLTYRTRNINPWLLSLAYRLAPTRKTRGADIMLVLLDFENKNGSQARVVGVNVPDTRKKIPVGILPVKHLLSESKHGKLLALVEKEFNEFVTELSPKQLESLDSFLPEDDEVAGGVDVDPDDELVPVSSPK